MFLDKDFLLTTAWAKKLFHEYAENQPIIDYHCHLDPAQIYEDTHFKNLAQVWLYDRGAGDHYKWRLLRANGTPEELITGKDTDDYARYLEFVKAVEKAAGNPIYEWSHLELRRFFGIDLIICQKNAREIWDRANEQIAKPDFSARNLLRRFGVRCVCTTDDPASPLKYHQLLAQEKDLGFKVLPTFRPDGLLGIESPQFAEYCKRLGDAAQKTVTDLASLEEVVRARVSYFHSLGGRLADQGMNSFSYVEPEREEVARIVERRLAGEELSEREYQTYYSHMTLFLMKTYAEHGWTMQIHGNCFRNASDRHFAAIGPDAGFDSVGDQPDFVFQLKCLLNAAEKRESLPKLILYSLNAQDWLALSSLCGSFEGGGVVQRIHFGNAWWFNDTLSGMKLQLTTYAEQSLLANFVGMLTDSRSFLSWPRHEYFRRVLCSVLGEYLERGQLPEDEAYLGALVEDICFKNAERYFGFFDDKKEQTHV